MSLTVSFQQARQENGAVDDLLEANKVLTFKLHRRTLQKCRVRPEPRDMPYRARIKNSDRTDNREPVTPSSWMKLVLDLLS